MATQFDPAVIHSFADRLYAQANSIVYQYAFLGFLVGCAVGGALGTSAFGSGLVPGLVAGLVVAALAAIAGRERGFTLRLQAQTALCQARIEANTRR